MDSTERTPYFVIPAGGTGTRFGTTIPKQYTTIAGKPILVYTLEAILPYAHQCVVSVAPNCMPFWQQLCKSYKKLASIIIVEGGATRFESVKNALAIIPNNCIVAIHDAVRPSISGETINQLLTLANHHEAVIPYKPLTDSIRMWQSNEANNAKDNTIQPRPSQQANRNLFVAVQTPQVFWSECIKQAYQQSYSPLFTDDCSVYEAYFHKAPLLYEDSYDNFKITTPTDAILFEALLAKK